MCTVEAHATMTSLYLERTSILDGNAETKVIAENNTGDTNVISYTSKSLVQDNISYEEVLGVGRTSSSRLNVSPKLDRFNVMTFEQDNTTTTSDTVTNTRGRSLTSATEYTFKLSRYSKLVRTSRYRKQELYIIYVEKYLGRDCNSVDIVLTLRKKVKHYTDESFLISSTQIGSCGCDDTSSPFLLGKGNYNVHYQIEKQVHDEDTCTQHDT